MYSLPQRHFLLTLARETLRNYLTTGTLPELDRAKIEPALLEPRATFVTLTKSGNLRGCIGSLVAHHPLAEDIQRNSVAAATEDPRFPPVTLAELPELHFEISVLTVPKKLNYVNSADLLQKLQPKKDGVILCDENCSATFLPQVWEELPSKEEFLSSLCEKAGLPGNAWQKQKLEVQVYEVEKFEEKRD